jgi:hypothetical protein
MWKETRDGLYQPVKAVTADSQWLFELGEDGAWECGHLPTSTVVERGLRSLHACRVYADSGKAREDLGRVQAHERGEHDASRVSACPNCRPARAH